MLLGGGSYGGCNKMTITAVMMVVVVAWQSDENRGGTDGHRSYNEVIRKVCIDWMSELSVNFHTLLALIFTASFGGGDNSPSMFFKDLPSWEW